MKQKVVIRVQMEDAKKRSKAMKKAVGVPGVLSAAIEGAEKNHIVVIGEGVDAITLTTLLRKYMGSADLVSVAAVDEKKESQKKQEAKSDGSSSTAPAVMAWPYHVSVPQYYYYSNEARDNYQDSCCIM